MKCYACGYEKRSKFVETAKVLRYKRGKRKGEIREVQEKTIDVFEDDPDFVKIYIAHGDISAYLMDFWPSYKEISLYACPNCGTLKINEKDL